MAMRRNFVQLASLLKTGPILRCAVQTKAPSLSVPGFFTPLLTRCRLTTNPSVKIAPIIEQPIPKVSTNRNREFNVRLATINDVDKILEISEGIYEGADYIPVVIHDWLKDKRKIVFIGEIEGNVIGMRVVTISEDQRSYVAQSLRIHPNYRGKNLSSKLIKSSGEYVLSKYPQATTRLLVDADTKGFGYSLRRNVSCKHVMPQSFHIASLTDATVDIPNHELTGLQLFSLSKQEALHLYKNKKVLDLIGSHGYIVVDRGFPHQLPQDAHLVANEVDRVFVDIPVYEILQHRNVPKSFSHGALSERVSKQIWICYIFTSDSETFKKHVVCQLNAAIDSYSGSKESEIHFYQSGSLTFDACRAVKDELARLKIGTNGDVSTVVKSMMVCEAMI